MRKHLLVFLLTAQVVVGFPTFASANAGIPLVAFVWPVAWLILLPVILIEAWAARHVLKLSWRQALRMSAYANVISTLIGIPITCAMELGIAALLDTVRVSSDFRSFLPLIVLWIRPAYMWERWVAVAALCPPFWAVSAWIEAAAARRWWTRNQIAEKRGQVIRWSLIANAITYGAVTAAFAAAVIWPK